MERFRSRNSAQSEKADDPPGDEDGSAINRSELTIDELVKMKALNHERMDAVRENCDWRLAKCLVKSVSRRPNDFDWLLIKLPLSSAGVDAL